MVDINKSWFPSFPSSIQNWNKRDFLILWKAPWNKSMEDNLYFNGSSNKFWELWNEEWLKGNKEKQIEFLKSNWIVLWDRMKEFIAKDNSSMDDKRKAESYNDIRWLLEMRLPYNKQHNYPTIILLWVRKVKESLEMGTPFYINFLDDNKKYNVEWKLNTLTKKEILNCVLNRQEKILIKHCEDDEKFKPFYLVACYDTSWGSFMTFGEKLGSWRKSWLTCLKKLKS